MTFTMEGFKGEPPSSIIPFFWSPGWNSVQSINKYQVEVGGPLHGGDPGRRLFEKDAPSKLNYFDIPNQSYTGKEDQYLIFPVYQIFGSEELSSEAPAIQERIPEQYFWMNPDDATAMNIKKDDKVELNIAGENIVLPVRIMLDIPLGLAGISVLANKKWIKFNEWVKIEKYDS